MDTNRTNLDKTILPSKRITIALLYAFVCHTIFVLGVGSMIIMMFFGMSRSFGTLQQPWGWLLNIVLLVQFPLIHSLLLSSKGKRILSKLAPYKLGETLSTTTYAIIASLQLLMLFIFWTPTGVILYQAQGIAFIVFCGLYTVSWLLLGKSMADTGLSVQLGQLGWWALLRDRKPIFPAMPTKGLFKLTRQPVYVTFTLTLWTVPCWTPDQLVLSSTLTLYCLIGPLFKEGRYRRLFGEKFKIYAARKPYFLPFPSLTKKPSRSKPGSIVRNDLTLYDRHADAWWDGSQRFLRLLHNIVPPRMKYFGNTIDTWHGLSVLDLGCGGGFMSEALARQGAKVVGVDPTEAAIKSARRHAELEELDIDYRVGAGEAIPLDDNCIDCVVCVDVLEHVVDLVKVIAEARRVLKPEGLFFFDTINRSWLATLIMINFGENILGLLPQGTHDSKKFIKPAELQSLLQQHDFSQAKLAGLGPCGINRRLDLTFGKLPSLSIMYMGHATLQS